MTTDFDQINQLGVTDAEEVTSKVSKMRSKPFDEYFGEMEISEEQKERRIELAEKLEDEMLFVLSLIAVVSAYQSVDWNYIEGQFEIAYTNALGGENANLDAYTQNHISQTSRELAESSEKNMGSDYNTSYDRARFIAENDANVFVNHDEHTEAIEAGYTEKTWNTMRDKKVRETHAELEGETIPIDEPFLVGDSLMDYPTDTSYGASAEEICGCRCSITYS